MNPVDPTRRSLLTTAAAGIAAPGAGAAARGPASGQQPPAERLRTIGVSPRDFGAAGDGRADDAPAVQAAVDACLGASPPTPLRVDGSFRLGRTVMIDRPVDRSGPRLQVVGEGLGAAFQVTGDVVMFSTRLPVRNDPASEGVVFRNIAFSADDAGRSAQCFSGGLLRIAFENCEWYRVRCLTSAIYAQSWHFRNCRAFDWRGVFFRSAGAYDVSLQLQVKFGATVLECVSDTWPITRLRVHDSVLEGLTGPAIRCGRAAGLSFDGNYCEYNGAPVLDLAAHPAGCTSVTVQGNTFIQSEAALADQNFFDVRWGRTRRGFSAGNYCNGRLHDTAQMTGPGSLLTIGGDVADLELFRGHATDSARRPASGNVQFAGDGAAVLRHGRNAVALDALAGGLAVSRGTAPPQRVVFGSANPQTDNAPYGNQAWGAGSRVFNDAPARGAPRGWICVASGTPGTWVAEEPL